MPCFHLDMVSVTLAGRQHHFFSPKHHQPIENRTLN